jgi:hypothetical protein
VVAGVVKPKTTELPQRVVLVVVALVVMELRAVLLLLALLEPQTPAAVEVAVEDFRAAASL